VGVMLFPTGTCISSFNSRYRTNITQLMREHGQYVGNHSISHPNLTTLSYAVDARTASATGILSGSKP
jgi:hypothetical protein